MKISVQCRPSARAMVGIGLIALACLIWWETRSLPAFAGHGLGAAALPRLIGAALAILGVLHLMQRRRNNGTEYSPAITIDWPPVLWIGAGFVLLAITIEVGGGFIPAIAALFVATSRGFGRRAILADLVVGTALATFAYLMFVKLLALTLPTGPLELLF